MPDTGTKSLLTRQMVVVTARSQIGCHYVWGAAGNRPGEADGAWYRKEAALLHPNDATGPAKGRRADHGRTQPIVNAAWCRVDGDKVCLGRCNDDQVKVLPHGDPTNEGQMKSNGYIWPRPGNTSNENTITSKHTVWGESCVGIRHFDCIGFVNWCISEQAHNVHMSIPGVIRASKNVGFQDVWAGDIVTVADHHIGIATGKGTVVHASGTREGVIETILTSTKHGKWDRCGRFPESWWLTGLIHIGEVYLRL